ncbi:hypothetical protein CEQ90_02470 [Lewinellaceae bacterium SD302]|nr:hypothetical protein CEQ90_02470 [Lewinellaceae bacterium SD302]
MRSLKSSVLLFVGVAFLFTSCRDDDDFIPVDDDSVDDAIDMADQTAQLIVEWSDLWLTTDQHTNGMRPTTIARALAYIHLTGYETAVPFMNDHTTNTSRFDELDIDVDELESNVNLDIALNTAYAMAIEHFMFSTTTFARNDIFRFRDEKLEELSEDLSQDMIRDSEQWGRYVARKVISFSETDEQAEEQSRNQTPSDYIAPVGDGLWVAADNEDAWFPYWREVRTFVIPPEETSSTAFSSHFTYSTETSSDYYITMTDVYETSTDAANGNEEELWIAEFWADDVEGIMISPPGRQFSIANQLIVQNDIGYESALVLFLKLGFSINDAAVSAWDDKYTYNTQRPSEYITEFIDEGFSTNLSRFITTPNPAFPSYPSGHATFASAAGGVFIDFFGTDYIDFTDNTYLDFNYITEFKGTPRSYTSFTEMAYENAYSRVPLGVHIIEDATEGLRLGYEISAAVNSFDLNN